MSELLRTAQTAQLQPSLHQKATLPVLIAFYFLAKSLMTGEFVTPMVNCKRSLAAMVESPWPVMKGGRFAL